MRSVIALGVGMLLSGCDGGGADGLGSADGGPIGSVAAGGGGRVIVANDSSLKLIDTGSDAEGASLAFDFFAEALHVAGDAVVLGGNGGELLVAEADTLELRGQLALGSTVEAITSLGDEAFVAVLGNGTSEDGPKLVRVDLANVAETSRFDDVDVNEQHGALLTAGDDVIVLVHNGFALQRVSSASETVTQAVPLGEDPSDPDGPRGEFYGYGMLAAVGDRYWVFDEYNNRLLGVDADSFEVQVVHDVTALLEDGGAAYAASSDTELFLTLADKDQIVVFDGDTGEVARTLDVADGARAIAVADGLIYIDADETIGDLLVLDAQSGAELGRVGAAFADFIAVASAAP